MWQLGLMISFAVFPTYPGVEISNSIKRKCFILMNYQKPGTRVAKLQECSACLENSALSLNITRFYSSQQICPIRFLVQSQSESKLSLLNCNVSILSLIVCMKSQPNHAACFFILPRIPKLTKGLNI